MGQMERHRVLPESSSLLLVLRDDVGSNWRWGISESFVTDADEPYRS